MSSSSSLRILMPTVRDPSPRRAPHRINTTTGTSRLTRRPRSPDFDNQPAPPIDPEIVGKHWFGIPVQFEVVEETRQLSGYQMYAVEKWITERTRAVIVLTVFTGDEEDKITVTTLAPAHSAINPQEEFDRATQRLSGDGTRRRLVTTNDGESEIGTIFITSLAQFHDTIVRIPSGSFLSVRSELYANIGLQRMNLAGRGVIGLGTPEPAVKDRFCSTYLIPMPAPTHKPKQASKSISQYPSLEMTTVTPIDDGDDGKFAEMVLALVRLLQAALLITGDLPSHHDPPISDGLLCDLTVAALEQSSTRDDNAVPPSTVASLLSRVIVARNQLASLPIHGNLKVTRDPFTHPKAFRKALAVYAQHSSSNPPSSSGTPQIPSTTPTHFTPPTGTTPIINTAPPTTPLTPALSISLASAADSKRVGVHRVLLNKLDEGMMDVTSDINVFVRSLMAAEKRESTKVAEAARALWGGRIKSTKEIERLKELERDFLSAGEGDEERENKTDGKTTDEEVEQSAAVTAAWSGRMQKKLGAWTSKARPTKSRTHSVQRIFGSMSDQNFHARDNDDDDMLSSGQQSPVDSPNPMNMLSAIDLLADQPDPPQIAHETYEERVRAFDSIRPRLSRFGSANLSINTPQRVASWSGQMPGGDPSADIKKERRKSRLAQSIDPDPDSDEIPFEQRLRSITRRHSFHDEGSFDDIRVLRLDRMRIDVEICGQLLIMHRRAEHLSNVIAYVTQLALKMGEISNTLKENHLSHASAIGVLSKRAAVLTQIEDARVRVDEASQERAALQYATAQLRVENLARQAAPPRQQVLMLRSRVFGAGGHARKLPTGVRGAYGRYNRVQWTLDGGRRLVDAHGRTESEVEEELAVDEEGIFDEIEEDEEEKEPVRNARIKPMWLLRFFTSWGARWSANPTDAETLPSETETGTEIAEKKLRSPKGPMIKVADESGDELELVVPGAMSPVDEGY